MENSYDAEIFHDQVLKNIPVYDVLLPLLLDLAGDVKDLRICDLACGQGVVGRAFAQRGATVVGVDSSERLLEMAQRTEDAAPLGITYVLDDAQTLATFDDALFDGIVCNMALMDIPDIAAVFRSVQRVLRPYGWFACTITHPCFQTPNSSWIVKEDGMQARVVSNYFKEGFWRSSTPLGVRGQVGTFHRTLSTYLNSFLASGLVFERLAEPQGGGQLAQRVPGSMEIPIALALLSWKVAEA